MSNVYGATGISNVIPTGLLLSQMFKSMLNFQAANPTRITSSGTDLLISNWQRLLNESIVIFFFWEQNVF